MSKDKVPNVVANLNALNLGDKSKVKIGEKGEVIDFTNLSEGLAGKKVKGTVYVDLDGDGIFDKQIKSRALTKDNPDDLASKFKQSKYDSTAVKDLSKQLVEIDDLLKNEKLTDKEIKNLRHREKEILKDFKKMEVISPKEMMEKVRAEAYAAKKAVEEKPKVETPAAETKSPEKTEEKGKYTSYIVQNGESPSSIANKFDLKGEEREKFIKELKEHNKDKLKTFKGRTTGKPVDGFLVGEQIELPGEFETKGKMKSREEAIAEWKKAHAAKTEDKSGRKTDAKGKTSVDKKVEDKSKTASDTRAESKTKAAATKHTEDKSKNHEAKKTEAKSKPLTDKKVEDKTKTAADTKAESKTKVAATKHTEDKSKNHEAKKTEAKSKPLTDKKVEDKTKATADTKAEDKTKTAANKKTEATTKSNDAKKTEGPKSKLPETEYRDGEKVYKNAKGQICKNYIDSKGTKVIEYYDPKISQKGAVRIDHIYEDGGKATWIDKDADGNSEKRYETYADGRKRIYENINDNDSYEHLIEIDKNNKETYYIDRNENKKFSANESVSKSEYYNSKPTTVNNTKTKTSGKLTEDRPKVTETPKAEVKKSEDAKINSASKKTVKLSNSRNVEYEYDKNGNIQSATSVFVYSNGKREVGNSKNFQQAKKEFETNIMRDSYLGSIKTGYGEEFLLQFMKQYNEEAKKNNKPLIQDKVNFPSKELRELFKKL